MRHAGRRARWREIIVVDDGSSDATGERARARLARDVIRHPYNKGNGAAVKTGARHAAGEFVLIVDGDGQHDPADACRLAARLGEFDLVVGARSAATQATLTRRGGNAVLNWLASYLTGRQIPDLTSGFRGIRRDVLREFLHLLPNGFSTPTTTTLACIKAGYNVAFEPIEAGTRAGHSKMRVARDGAKFLLILLRVITIFSPLRIFAPLSAAAFAVGVGLRAREFCQRRPHPERRSRAAALRRHRVPGGTRVRADRLAAISGTSGSVRPSISVFFPCYNDSTPSAIWCARRSAAAAADRRLRDHRRQRRLAGRQRRRCCARLARRCRGSESSRTSGIAATAARCAAASRPRPRTSSSTPTATASTTSASCRSW